MELEEIVKIKHIWPHINAATEIVETTKFSTTQAKEEDGCEYKSKIIYHCPFESCRYNVREIENGFFYETDLLMHLRMIHSKEDKKPTISIMQQKRARDDTKEDLQSCKKNISTPSSTLTVGCTTAILASPNRNISKKKRGRPATKSSKEFKSYSILPKPAIQLAPTAKIDMPLGMRKKSTKRNITIETTTACSPLSLEQLLEASTQTNVPYQASTQTNTTFQDSKQTNTVCTSILNTSQTTQTQLQKDFNSNSTQTADLLNDLVNEDIFINYLDTGRRQSNCSEKYVQTSTNKGTIVLGAQETDTNDSFQLELESLVFEGGKEDSLREIGNANNVQDIALSPIPQHFFDEFFTN
ncbi:DgyrCDS2037 [Dimorphilus gyrociliatus]|uniref:DgyrCDS2037 n=1 Tax=Dimorphilus gyrociliatus TaxID=2664684 RepID=A0A7I8V937_9ANNE|nr:DgyrCDS2037 [Dimorphilus gyrociliatus]